jgi:hypothetical protein
MDVARPGTPALGRRTNARPDLGMGLSSSAAIGARDTRGTHRVGALRLQDEREIGEIGEISKAIQKTTSS